MQSDSHFIPVLPTGVVSKLLCPLHREGAGSHTSPKDSVFWWTGPSKDMGLTCAGTPQDSAPRNRVRCPRCRAPPVHMLVGSDPEPLRAGPELTNS